MDNTAELGLTIGGITLGLTATIIGVGAVIDWLLRRR